MEKYLIYIHNAGNPTVEEFIEDWELLAWRTRARKAALELARHFGAQMPQEIEWAFRKDVAKLMDGYGNAEEIRNSMWEKLMAEARDFAQKENAAVR